MFTRSRFGTLAIPIALATLMATALLSPQVLAAQGSTGRPAGPAAVAGPDYTVPPPPGGPTCGPYTYIYITSNGYYVKGGGGATCTGWVNQIRTNFAFTWSPDGNGTPVDGSTDPQGSANNVSQYIIWPELGCYTGTYYFLRGSWSTSNDQSGNLDDIKSVPSC